jgi:hypothetical protein
MPSTPQDMNSPSDHAPLLADAKQMTEKVEGDLALAAAELHLSNVVIAKSISGEITEPGIIDRALEQNTIIEKKVEVATVELKQVTQLLSEAEAKLSEPPAA